MYSYIASEETYENGQIIFEEGSSGDWVYVILSGSVEISKIDKDKKVVVEVLQKEEIFGELSFLGGIKRSATVLLA
jgi:CRP-like cAMP-binding protein